MDNFCYVHDIPVRGDVCPACHSDALEAINVLVDCQVRQRFYIVSLEAENTELRRQLERWLANEPY